MKKEKELIEAIARGDESALQCLYALYHPRLVRFLYRLTRDPDHIMEIVNDVFLAVWHGAGRFRGESSVSTWVLGIAYKKGLKHLSRWRDHQPLLDTDPVDEEAEARIHGERSADQVLAYLTPPQRAVVELTYFFGYSYREIGEIVGCPENTVKTRMFHARQKLRALLEDSPNV